MARPATPPTPPPVDVDEGDALGGLGLDEPAPGWDHDNAPLEHPSPQTAVARRPSRVMQPTPSAVHAATMNAAAPAQALALAATQTPNDIAVAHHGASTLVLTKEEAGILAEPPPDDIVSIRPDNEGIVYVEHTHVRKLLTRALGPGQWVVVPQGPTFLDPDTPEKVYRTYHLFVRGHFMKEAVGDAEHRQSNRKLTRADTLESIESNAIVRASKSLNVYSQCWEKGWREAWRARHAIRVRVKDRSGTVSIQWRRRDQAPLPGEFEVLQEKAAPTSPTTGPSVSAPAASSKPANATTPAQGGVSRNAPVRGADGPKPAPPVSREPGDEDDLLHDEAVPKKSGGTFTIQIHRDYNDREHVSKPKIARLMIQAFVAARQAGVPEAEQSAEVQMALARLAQEHGLAHFSLCPYKGQTYDEMVTEVGLAFSGGGQ